MQESQTCRSTQVPACRYTVGLQVTQQVGSWPHGFVFGGQPEAAGSEASSSASGDGGKAVTMVAQKPDGQAELRSSLLAQAAMKSAIVGHAGVTSATSQLSVSMLALTCAHLHAVSAWRRVCTSVPSLLHADHWDSTHQAMAQKSPLAVHKHWLPCPRPQPAQDQHRHKNSLRDWISLPLPWPACSCYILGSCVGSGACCCE